MNDSEFSITKTIKNIVQTEFKKQKPSSFFIGTVESVKPLKVRKDQKLVITERFLLLTDAVKNIEQEVEIEWTTETNDNHIHTVKGKKIIKLNNELKTGEKVLVLQNNGGQEFIILERVSNT